MQMRKTSSYVRNVPIPKNPGFEHGSMDQGKCSDAAQDLYLGTTYVIFKILIRRYIRGAVAEACESEDKQAV
jgi:hypothetical protein